VGGGKRKGGGVVLCGEATHLTGGRSTLCASSRSSKCWKLSRMVLPMGARRASSSKTVLSMPSSVEVLASSKRCSLANAKLWKWKSRMMSSSDTPPLPTSGARRPRKLARELIDCSHGEGINHEVPTVSCWDRKHAILTSSGDLARKSL
jgi:hypothetical protein